MSPAARLRRRAMHWVWDGRPEWLTLLLWTWNVGRVLCLFAGHEPIFDHCGRPEHVHCCWCNKAIPGQAHRPGGAV